MVEPPPADQPDREMEQALTALETALAALEGQPEAARAALAPRIAALRAALGEV